MTPFIPQMQPWFDEQEKNAIAAYLDAGGWMTEFKETKKFGSAIAEFTGSKYCSILANGSLTMTAALIALDIIHKEDEVIIPAYTMIATPNATMLAGATPVFCDVEKETMCLDFEGLQQVVTNRTRAIMLVSINGRYPKNLSHILDYCKEKDIAVIEDAAQSLGSFHQGKHVGTFGAVGSFSFSMPKIITTGQGGALVTDDEELYKKIELIKNFGRKEAGIDDHIFFGLNFKFTDLQAIVGIEQMKKLEMRIDLKRKIYRKIVNALGVIPQLRFFDTHDETTPWFNDVLVEDREKLIPFLKENGIGSRQFYPATHTQAPYHQPAGLFPNADHLAEKGLWLPSYAQLSEEESDRIINAISRFYS